MPTPEIASTFLTTHQRIDELVRPLAGTPTSEVLDRWASTAPTFDEVAAAADVWPAAIDIVTHEHDIRHGLGRPGDRESDAVGVLAEVLVQWWTPSRAVEVVTPTRTIRRGPGDDEPLRWTSTEARAGQRISGDRPTDTMRRRPPRG